MKGNRFNTYSEDQAFRAAKQYILDSDLCRKYAKGEYHTRQGGVGFEFGIVTKGYFKYTTQNSAGEEAVLNFAFENDFVVDFKSSLFGRPSEVSIIAGADSEVKYVPVDEIRELFVERDDESSASIYKSLYDLVYNRIIEVHRYSPKERYLSLVERFPQLFQTVTLRDVAAYLLITPTHLSRIRREIAEGK